MAEGQDVALGLPVESKRAKANKKLHAAMPDPSATAKSSVNFIRNG